MARLALADPGLTPDGHADQWRQRLKRPGPPREHRNSPSGPVEFVGEDARCDRDFEDAEATRRRAAFVEERARKLEQRLQERRLLTLGQRLDKTSARLEAAAGGMRSRPIEAVRPSAEHEQAGPPPVEDDGRWRQSLTLIEHHLSVIEAEADARDGLLRSEPPDEQGFYEAPGHSGSLSVSRMIRGAEKDRVVFDDFAGVRSEDVAREAPYLGTSARTIERARAREAERRGFRVRLVDGVILGEVERAA